MRNAIAGDVFAAIVPKFDSWSWRKLRGSTHPTYMHIESALNGNSRLVVKVSSASNSDIPPILSSGTAPSDSEHSELVTIIGTSTTMHAQVRLKWNRSRINATATSAREIVDVKAAIASSKKKSDAHMRGKEVHPKISGMVMNTRV